MHGTVDQLITSVVTIATAIVGLAVLAVLVSRNSNTAGVIGAGGSAFTHAITAAVSPISGGGYFGGGAPITSDFGSYGYGG